MHLAIMQITVIKEDGKANRLMMLTAAKMYTLLQLISTKTMPTVKWILII